MKTMAGNLGLYKEILDFPEIPTLRGEYQVSGHFKDANFSLV